MLAYSIQKIKDFIQTRKFDILLIFVITFVGAITFGLGRLSVLWQNKAEIRIDQSLYPAVSSFPSQDSGNQVSGVVVPLGKYVASRNGGKYHLPTCPGAQQIKEENKIWFQTRKEAEDSGYKPAANCQFPPE